jgi:predicted nucleotidyltransferase
MTRVPVINDALNKSFLKTVIRCLVNGIDRWPQRAYYFDYEESGKIGDRNMISEEIINEVKNRLAENFHPRRIILFGSQARETADEKSDVDILVVCPFQGSRRALMVKMDRALKGLPIARDIMVLTPEEFERDRHIPGTVARPAWKEGKVLYEAS